jgi:hypothetical protein
MFHLVNGSERHREWTHRTSQVAPTSGAPTLDAKELDVRVFLGSSTQAAEAGDLEFAAKLLEDADLIPKVWTHPGTFSLSAATWDSLQAILRDVDAAAFIFREDDIVISARGVAGAPRNNVLLEFGLFSGKLGAENCAMLVRGNPAIPSDLKGITYISLDDPETLSHLLAWGSRLRSRIIDEPFQMSYSQVEAVVKAMRRSKITHNNIYLLMKRLGVIEAYTSRALSGKR